jgi:hypothetical protein
MKTVCLLLLAACSAFGASRRITAAEVLAAIQRNPEFKRGMEIEVLDVSAVEVEGETLAFPWHGIRRGPGFQLLWRGSIDGRMLPGIWARVRAVRHAPVLVAVEDALPGSSELVARIEQVECGLTDEPGLGSLRELEELQPIRHIRRGERLQSNAFRRRVVINRGDAVRLLVRRGNARLLLEAIAETQAAAGEPISLRSEQGRRVLRATALRAGTAELVVAGGAKP